MTRGATNARHMQRAFADAGVKAVVSNMLGHVHGSNLLTKAWEGARQWQDEANAVIRHANYTTPADLFTDFSGATAGN